MNETYLAYLEHHGIKGQRHGVRRYQYEDGSLTPEGRKRYGSAYRKYAKKAQKLEDKRVKAGLKAAKADKALYSAKKKFQKAERKDRETSELESKVAKLEKKSVKLNLKSAKLEKKAAKYLKKMEKKFREIGINDIPADDLAAGKQYSYMLLRAFDTPAVKKHDRELTHHGIKGQKHGVRRWQNEDGSLTPAGRERYLKGGMKSRSGKQDVESTKKKARKLYAKGLNEAQRHAVKKVRTFVKNSAPVISGAAWLASAVALGSEAIVLNKVAAYANLMALGASVLDKS